MIKIRGLEHKDLEVLYKLYRGMYEEVKMDPLFSNTFHKNGPTANEILDWAATIYKTFGEGKSVVSIAELNGKVVGICYILTHMPYEDETSHLGRLAVIVDKSSRSRGVGSALLKESIKKARWKFDSLYLITFATNERAKKLYKKFGFEVSGRIPNEVKRNGKYIDVEYMYKPLRSSYPKYRAKST